MNVVDVAKKARPFWCVLRTTKEVLDACDLSHQQLILKMCSDRRYLVLQADLDLTLEDFIQQWFEGALFD